MRRSRAAAPVLAAVAIAVLAGCTPIVAMDSAEHANDPACADIIARLPDDVAEISSYALRQTDAQSTAAWGEPTVALLYCGVPVPGPSELPCVPIDGISWLREELPPGGDADFAYTTFGRDPATRVVIDSDVVAPGIVLDDLAGVVAFTPENGRECLAFDDTVTGSQPPGDEPATTPSPTGTPSPSDSPSPSETPGD